MEERCASDNLSDQGSDVQAGESDVSTHCSIMVNTDAVISNENYDTISADSALSNQVSDGMTAGSVSSSQRSEISEAAVSIGSVPSQQDLNIVASNSSMAVSSGGNLCLYYR